MNTRTVYCLEVEDNVLIGHKTKGPACYLDLKTVEEATFWGIGNNDDGTPTRRARYHRCSIAELKVRDDDAAGPITHYLVKAQAKLPQGAVWYEDLMTDWCEDHEPIHLTKIEDTRGKEPTESEMAAETAAAEAPRKPVVNEDAEVDALRVRCDELKIRWTQASTVKSMKHKISMLARKQRAAELETAPAA